MGKVSTSLTVEKLQNALDAKATAKRSTLQDKQLVSKFLECSKDNEYLEEAEEKKKHVKS